jgi:chromosome segregation ATPase
LPQTFRELIEKGRLEQIAPRGSESQIDSIRREVREEMDSLIAEKQREIDELRAVLRRGRQDKSPEIRTEIETLRAQLDAERATHAKLAGDAESAERLAVSMQDEVAAARAEIDRLRGVEGEVAELQAMLEAVRARAASDLQDMRISLRAELQAALTEAKENLETAREMQRRIDEVHTEAKAQSQAIQDLQSQVETARAESRGFQEFSGELKVQVADATNQLDTARQEAQGLSDALGDAKRELGGYQEERATLADEFAALRARLETVEQERDATQTEHASLVARAESLLSQIEMARGEFANKQQEDLARIEELEQSLVHQAATAIDPQELEQAKAEADRLRAELETARSTLENESQRLSAEVADLERAGDAVREELAQARQAQENARTLHTQLEGEGDALRARLEQAEQERDRARTQFEETDKARRARETELDALSHEAAAQVAAAIAQTGEVEGRLARLRQSHDALGQAARDAGAQLAAVASIIMQLSDQLNTACPEGVEPLRLSNALPLLAPMDLLDSSGEDGRDQTAPPDAAPAAGPPDGKSLLSAEDETPLPSSFTLDKVDAFENEQTSI